MKTSTQNTRLQPIGDSVYTNQDGYLVKTVSTATLQKELLPLIDQIISTAKSLFPDTLHSVYIRGSVAKGTFIAGISDVDPVIVTSMEPDDISFESLKAAFIKLRKSYPSTTNIEKNVQTIAHFVSSNNPIYKYQAVCVYGDDLSIGMPELKPGKQTVVHLPKIIKSIQENYPIVEARNSAEDINHWAIWMCKQLIRSAHELVAEELQRFARDIYPCYEGATKIYPSYEPLLREVAEVAVFGTEDKQRLLDNMHKMEDFLTPEIKKFYE